MLTVQQKPVDGGAASAPPDGLWMTISDIARAKGVSKQAISKRVDRFVTAGALATRNGARGAVMVNLAAYDKAAGEVGDSIRELAQKPAPVIAEDSTLAKEQTRRTQYQADIAKLELDERTGKLLPVEDVTAAMTRCAEIMVRTLDQMPSRADELATAVARDGEQGARAFLKTFAREVRSILAREMRILERGDRPDTPEETETD